MTGRKVKRPIRTLLRRRYRQWKQSGSAGVSKPLSDYDCPASFDGTLRNVTLPLVVAQNCVVDRHTGEYLMVWEPAGGRSWKMTPDYDKYFVSKELLCSESGHPVLTRAVAYAEGDTELLSSTSPVRGSCVEPEGGKGAHTGTQQWRYECLKIHYPIGLKALWGHPPGLSWHPR